MCLPHRRKARAGSIPLLLLLIVLAMLGQSTPGLGGQSGSPACSPAPPFTLLDLEGQSRSLADFLGTRPILLEFMSTDCPHCAQAALVLSGLHAEYGARVQFLTVALESSGKTGRVRAIAQRHQHPWPYLLGNDGVIQTYQLEGVPTFFLLSRTGGVCGVRVGTAPAEVLRKGLEMVLALE